MAVDMRKNWKEVKYEKSDMYLERGQQLMEEFAAETNNPEHADVRAWSYGFTTYDDKGRYIGKFEAIALVDEADEAKGRQALTAIAQRNPVLDIVDPPLWAKAWDWLTKTKG
jgi:ABC-type Fe3+ transport system substrate-binding protein